MKDDRKKIIERARKLMAMAADSSSPNEAAIAARRARALIDKYQLSIGDLEERTEFGMAKGSRARRATPRWEQHLAIKVANLNDCIVKYDGAGALTFAGFDEDATVAAFMFGYITDACKRQCDSYIKTQNRFGNRNAFKWGFARAIGEKIDEMLKERQAQVMTSTGTSLMVVKKELVEKEFGGANYGQQRANVAKDHHAAAAGHAAGRRTNIVTGVSDKRKAAARLR